MKYIDKNGFEWTVDKGDWIGSFDRTNRKQSVISLLKKFSFPLFLIIILSFILLNWD